MTEHPRRYFEDVAIGDPLPKLEFEVTLTSLVIYAGATWDFHRYHYDADFVRQSGVEAPFMDGQMLGALVSNLLMKWGGRDAFLRKLSYRQKANVLVGDIITIEGKVVGKEDITGASCIACSLSVTAQKAGIVAQGITASIELTRRRSAA